MSGHGPRTALAGLATVALVMLSLVPSSLAQDAGAGVEYELIITCPDGAGFAISTTSRAVGCPVRAVDEQDAMGDPTLAVDPFRPNIMVIASLHGSVGGGGPDGRARSGQVFTTFTSEDAGASWRDNPFFPPEELDGFGYGITPGLTIDPYGHVYVGSLYALSDDSSGGPYDYVIAAQKFSNLGRINTEQSRSSGAYNAEYLDPVFPGNRIEQTWFLFDPAQDNMTLVWHESLTERAQDPPGNASALRISHPTAWHARTPDAGARAEAAPPGAPLPLIVPEAGQPWPLAPDGTRVTAPAAGVLPGAAAAVPDARPLAPGVPADVLGLLQEQDADTNHTSNQTTSTTQPPAPANRTAPRAKVAPMSAIGLAWTTPSVNDTYYYQSVRHTIGPCSASTNPVLSDGYLYIGCVVADGEGPLRWDPQAGPGSIALFRMDPSGGEPVYLGKAPIDGPAPKLGVRSDGRLALLSAVATEGRLAFHSVFGTYDEGSGKIAWGTVGEHGHDISPPEPSYTITDAAVQDMIYREYSGVLHLILKTRTEPQGVGVGSLTSTLSPSIRKHLVALDERHGVLVVHGLDIGNPVNRTTDPTLMQMPEEAFDDLSDDFLQMPEGPFMWDGVELGPAYQREYFAVGDYGQVQFAEVVELTTLRGPAAVPVNPPPPPVPAPAVSATAAVVPTAGLVSAAALAATILAQKRSDPLKALKRKRT